MDGVAEFMGRYGLVWVAGLVHALSDAFDVGGGDGSDRVFDNAPITLFCLVQPRRKRDEGFPGPGLKFAIPQARCGL